MKPKNCSSKKPASRNSDLLLRRLATYSATAGAALLAAPVANAAIQNIKNINLSLDLPQNGGQQNLIFNAGPFNGTFQGSRGYYKRMSYMPGSSSPGIPPYTDTLGVYHPGTPGFYNPGYSITVGSYRYGRASLLKNIARNGSAQRLNKGISFGGLSFSDGAHLLASRSYYGSAYGNFMNQSGYIAFQTGSYYGWLKVKVGLDSNGVPNKISLVDNGSGIYGAYDKASDVTADGFTVGAMAVPEPSVTTIAGLSLLAFGAAGVRELRRRRRQFKARQ